MYDDAGGNWLMRLPQVSSMFHDGWLLPRLPRDFRVLCPGITRMIENIINGGSKAVRAVRELMFWNPAGLLGWPDQVHFASTCLLPLF